MGNKRNRQKKYRKLLEDFAPLFVGVGATILFSILSPKNTLMRFIFGLLAIIFVIYGISVIILARRKKLHIPFWSVLILDGIIGIILFGLLWMQTIGAFDGRRVSTISNAEFRKIVIRFSNDLRGLEQNFQSKERSLILSPITGTPEQQAKIREERRAKEQEIRQEYENEFKKRYLARALDYRTELYFRLRTTPPKDEFPQIVALTGMLAGPYPLNNLATYLERLARRLGD